ncbi:MAG: gamma-glutamyl-gamma-aminobutyrate hydrolase family protein [Alphaproteobacteria bacterium]|nr:gamma-glutamyl-gamma-aminobutyrate hydrolase family protein [Alphaproteobacteria bacterium]
MRTDKPLIAVTLDCEAPGGYSKMPWYALRQNYCDAILVAGGIPFPVSHHPELAEEYANIADGFVFTGGAFDIDPSLYGVNQRHDTVTTKINRTAFEWQLMQLALTKGKPILGICGGMQLLNVVLGGTLIQHIPDEVSNCLSHEQPNPRTEPGHEIEVYKDTLLYSLIKDEMVEGKISVNSAHHQAIKKIAEGLCVNSIASDGVIEGIEDPSQPFRLGVQWHPEYHVSEADKRIFMGFIQAASR